MCTSSPEVGQPPSTGRRQTASAASSPQWACGTASGEAQRSRHSRLAASQRAHGTARPDGWPLLWTWDGRCMRAWGAATSSTRHTHATKNAAGARPCQLPAAGRSAWRCAAIVPAQSAPQHAGLPACTVSAMDQQALAGFAVRRAAAVGGSGGGAVAAVQWRQQHDQQAPARGGGPAPHSLSPRNSSDASRRRSVAPGCVRGTLLPVNQGRASSESWPGL